MDDKSQPNVFLSATLWWPAAARLAMAFLKSGCTVSAVCPSGHPLRMVRGIRSVHPYRALSPARSLESAIRAERPDLIVPCDDGAVWHLHSLYRREPEFRPLIERSLGSNEAFATLQRRNLVMKTAADLGIRVPRTREVQSHDDLDDPEIDWPAVLKIDGTWGGEGVAIVRNPAEASEAYDSLLRASGSRRAWKRFLTNRHPLALWLWWRGRTPAVSLQSFIPGRPATTLFACWQGEVLANITVEVLATTGPTGAATVIRSMRDDHIDDACRLLARKFMLSGLHGLDFILEEGTGAAYMIEMNPRATQLGHLSLTPLGNLADALTAKLVNSTAHRETARRIQSDTIVLFPLEWKANPGNPLLTEAFHDVPWEQPELVRELLRNPWPERRLLHRLFSPLWANGQPSSTRARAHSRPDQSSLAS